jgi:6-phosphogluconolactonase
LGAIVRARGRASFVLAGGKTPLDLYRQLADPWHDVPWESVHVFWGDERLVPPDDPGSNYGAARETLLSRVPIPVENIHRIKGELPAAAAVADYTEQLRAWAAVYDPDAPYPWPRFDLVLLGLGEDGHTASLFPGSPVGADAPVMAVTADYQGRPAGRVTLTPPVFNDARRVFFLVSGEGKADAVYNTFNTDDPVRFPAQRIRPDAGEVLWLLDRRAAARLERPLTTDDRLTTNDY